MAKRKRTKNVLPSVDQFFRYIVARTNYCDAFMGNCVCAKSCQKHGLCFNKRTHPIQKRQISRMGTGRSVVVPNRRVEWKTNLVDGYVDMNTKHQGKAKFNTNEELSSRDNVRTHKRKRKKRRKKETPTDETLPLQNSTDSNDIVHKRSRLPQIDTLGKRHSLSPLYYKSNDDRTRLHLKPLDEDILFRPISHDELNLTRHPSKNHQKEHRRKKMKKNKRKKICEKDKNTTGKWLTDDTITGESEQTILN